MDQGRLGTGRFQWNRGGWFGGQVGGTLWLVLLGGLLWTQGQREGLWILTLGLAANAFGCLLWSRRETVAPYPALQLMLGCCGVAAGLSMALLVHAGIASAEVGLPTLWFLLLYPMLMLVFHVQERQARGGSTDPGS